MSIADLDSMATVLEQSGEYKVLRKLVCRTRYKHDDGSEKKVGVVVDVETTGLDPEVDEIIELGAISFEFNVDGEIFSIKEFYESFNQPSAPIPPHITDVTGITDEMVVRKRIDWKKVANIVNGASLVIAHNAAFDRRFLEKKSGEFKKIGWACSINDVDWRKEGFDGVKLSYILSAFGLFHDGHRALEDCRALLEILSRNLPKSKETVLSELLASARTPTYKLWANNPPFDKKDLLKKRGYRWANAGKVRAWWIYLREDCVSGEIDFLEKEVFCGQPLFNIQRITAYDRYSVRS